MTIHLKSRLWYCQWLGSYAPRACSTLYPLATSHKYTAPVTKNIASSHKPDLGYTPPFVNNG